VNVTLFPTSAPHKEGFTVKSSDTGVAQTSAADGCFTIKANKAGTATITVTAKGGAFAECKVTVFNSSFVPGDVNGDGTVNNKDVVLLFRYVSGTDVEVNIAALDVNGDGSVNNKDVVTLFRYVSGADITLSDKPYTTTP
jgi:sulfur carrier protein ThiS